MLCADDLMPEMLRLPKGEVEHFLRGGRRPRACARLLALARHMSFYLLTELDRAHAKTREHAHAGRLALL